mgnify:CR=1 FL=1
MPETVNENNGEETVVDGKEDIKYRMAFFDWYRQQNGFWYACRVFFLQSLIKEGWL